MKTDILKSNFIRFYERAAPKSNYQRIVFTFTSSSLLTLPLDCEQAVRSSNWWSWVSFWEALRELHVFATTQRGKLLLSLRPRVTFCVPPPSLFLQCWFQTVLNNPYTLCMLSCPVVPYSLRQHGLTVACQAPLSTEFSRQEYWGGFPCPPPGQPRYQMYVSFLSCFGRWVLYPYTTWEARYRLHMYKYSKVRFLTA